MKTLLRTAFIGITVGVSVLLLYEKGNCNLANENDSMRFASRQMMANLLLELAPENLLEKIDLLEEEKLKKAVSFSDSHWVSQFYKINVLSAIEDEIDAAMDKKVLVVYGYGLNVTLVIFKKQKTAIGEIIWQSEENIIANMADIKYIKDINKDGKKEIIILTGSGGHGYEYYIYSWNGKTEKILTRNGDPTQPSFHSYRDVTEFIDIDGDGIDEIIENSASYPGVGPLSRIKTYYKWDGKNYMFWKEETKILEQKK